MRKRTTFKALLVAAAVMTTGAVSVIGASAEMNRTAPDPIAPPTLAEAAVPASSATAEAPLYTETPDTPVTPIPAEKPSDVETPDDPIENTTETETEINGMKVTIREYEIDGKKMKDIQQDISDMELVEIEEDGTHVYKMWDGGTFRAWSADGNYDDAGCAMLYYDF